MVGYFGNQHGHKNLPAGWQYVDGISAQPLRRKIASDAKSVDTVTKFRFPEGINWVERKADLQ